MLCFFFFLVFHHAWGLQLPHSFIIIVLWIFMAMYPWLLWFWEFLESILEAEIPCNVYELKKLLIFQIYWLKLFFCHHNLLVPGIAAHFDISFIGIFHYLTHQHGEEYSAATILSFSLSLLRHWLPLLLFLPIFRRILWCLCNTHFDYAWHDGSHHYERHKPDLENSISEISRIFFEYNCAHAYQHKFL